MDVMTILCQYTKPLFQRHVYIQSCYHGNDKTIKNCEPILLTYVLPILETQKSTALEK